MKSIKEILPRAAILLLIFTLICGVFYTGAVTGIAQLLFNDKANGSIIQVNGKSYGSELLAQQYIDEKHMWGRIMNIDVTTFIDENGNALMYATPSNLSPASEKFEKLVASRVQMIKEANPDMADTSIPVELVTCSASGLDPHISPSAANYQIERLAKANNLDKAILTEIINSCTSKRFLGLFGEESVNVLKVNLMLDGIL